MKRIHTQRERDRNENGRRPFVSVETSCSYTPRVSEKGERMREEYVGGQSVTSSLRTQTHTRARRDPTKNRH